MPYQDLIDLLLSEALKRHAFYGTEAPATLSEAEVAQMSKVLAKDAAGAAAKAAEADWLAKGKPLFR